VDSACSREQVERWGVSAAATWPFPRAAPAVV